jgi:hypothetical protein
MATPSQPPATTQPSANAVQRTRAWTGLWVVIAGDVAIAAAAIWGIVKTAGTATTNSPTVAILTSAFTAIGTMTTAYFGIRATSNTAQSLVPAIHTITSGQNGGPSGQNSGPSGQNRGPSGPSTDEQTADKQTANE